MEKTQTYFHISKKEIVPLNTIVQKIVNKYVLGIFVARKGGDILYSKQFSDKLQLDLMGNFIAALSMFGEENVGKIKRIFIEGLDIEMNVVVKHDLILTMLFKPDMVKDYLPEFYEKGLNLFYKQFKEHIEKNKNNKAIYHQFDNQMCALLYEYLYKINAI